MEIGIGFEAARKPGSEVHDEIAWDQEKGYTTERPIASGACEGGMTTWDANCCTGRNETYSNAL